MNAIIILEIGRRNIAFQIFDLFYLRIQVIFTILPNCLLSSSISKLSDSESLENHPLGVFIFLIAYDTVSVNYVLRNPQFSFMKSAVTWKKFFACGLQN